MRDEDLWTTLQLPVTTELYKRYSSEILPNPEIYSSTLFGIATFRHMSPSHRAKTQRSIIQTPGFMMTPIILETSCKLGLGAAQAGVAGATTVAALIWIVVVNFMAHKESDNIKRELAAHDSSSYALIIGQECLVDRCKSRDYISEADRHRLMNALCETETR